jgi:hypothetical protein
MEPGEDDYIRGDYRAHSLPVHKEAGNGHKLWPGKGGGDYFVGPSPDAVRNAGLAPGSTPCPWRGGNNSDVPPVHLDVQISGHDVAAVHLAEEIRGFLTARRASPGRRPGFPAFGHATFGRARLERSKKMRPVWITGLLSSWYSLLTAFDLLLAKTGLTN